jgi:uncharacterized protein (TIGR02271 family)
MDESPIGRVADLRGTPVFDRDGDKIASVDDVFLDDDSGKPEWLALRAGLMSTGRVLVPVQGATVETGEIHVPYAAEHVKGSPTINSDEISEETEQELYAYYGLAYSRARSDSGLAKGFSSTERNVDEVSVTRSEEELEVGTREVETGRVRLRKWVETEPITADVEVQHETARVERVAVNQPVADVELGADEIEIPLTAEKPVVNKEVVAKERVSVTKDVETRPEIVTEQVRKERVEIQDDDLERG